jgi:proline iminopeptidase
MTYVPVLPAYDGTKLAYRVLGEGTPVVCLAGGPMQDSASLGELGGLPGRVQVILLDYRGTGRSETPADAGSYRCDRLVDDVEALREHLGLDQINLLAHCAGANLAVLYATRHPERVGKLALITPSTRAVGITATSEMRRAVVRLREREPWFAVASIAFEAVQAGQATPAHWEAMTPLTYGRWDAAARAHHASGEKRRNEEAAAVFGAEGAYDPTVTRATLATSASPVLLLAGEVDVAAPPSVVAEMASLFPRATLVTQPGGGHVPWLDDPGWFSTTIAAFLD